MKTSKQSKFTKPGLTTLALSSVLVIAILMLFGNISQAKTFSPTKAETYASKTIKTSTKVKLNCGAGKCGAGKCGASSKKADIKTKDVKAKDANKAMDQKSGKCGTSSKKAELKMKNVKAKDAQKTMNKKSDKCGAGKCGSGK